MPLLENRYRVRPGLSRGITSFTTDCAVPSWGFLVSETKSNFSCRPPRIYIGSSRSIVHLSISFPLLRRPSTVIIPLSVACYGETFHKLLMIIVVESSLSVSADIGSPRSSLFLNNCNPGILTSITSLLRAY